MERLKVFNICGILFSNSIDVKTEHETQNVLVFGIGKSKIELNSLGLRLNALLWSFWCTCTGC